MKGKFYIAISGAQKVQSGREQVEKIYRGEQLPLSGGVEKDSFYCLLCKRSY